MIWIDGSLYPDKEVPEHLDFIEEKIDFIARVCAAWDFGLLPDKRTLQILLSPEWKKAVDETRQLTSCAYHLLREFHGLETLSYLGVPYPEILNDDCLRMM
jgi:hypothetical protein